MKEQWNHLSGIARLGLIVMLISVPLFLFLPAIPFLPFNSQIKTGVGVGVFIAAEVLFYGGAAMAGKDVVQRIYARFRPKKNND